MNAFEGSENRYINLITCNIFQILARYTTQLLYIFEKCTYIDLNKLEHLIIN